MTSFKDFTFRDYFSLPATWLIRVVSWLPLSLLYAFSSVLYLLIYRVFRYRVSVVRENLSRSFPQKHPEELLRLEKAFYQHFTDTLVEVVKLRSISPKELKRRCRYTKQSVDLLKGYFKEGKSVMIALAHKGNWEWGGAAFPLYHNYQVITAYRNLKNKAFNQDVLKMRQRTGNILATMKALPREMVRNREKTIATALIADQKPPKGSSFWIMFLNQETDFFKGTELLSQKYKLPVFWASLRKVRRGYYEVDLRLITEQPQNFTDPGSVTSLFASELEKDIFDQPETWLWSHRRWKNRRATSDPILGANGQKN